MQYGRKNSSSTNPRPFANASGVLLNDLDQFDQQYRRQRAAFAHASDPVPKCIAIAKNFFRMRVFDAALDRERTKKLIRRGDDSLDFTTELGFLQRQRVQQDVLIRNQIPASFEFRQPTMRRDSSFQYRRRFDFVSRRQSGKVVERVVRD